MVTICHLWPTFLPFQTGGVESYILTLSNYLSDVDPDANFLLVTDKSNISYVYSRKISKCQQYGKLKVIRFGPNILSFLEGIYFKVFHSNCNLLKNLITRTLYREIVKSKEMQNVDVFHIHGLWETRYPLIGLYMSQHYNRPLLVSLHGESANNQNDSMHLDTPEAFNVLNSAKIITTFSKDVLFKLWNLGFYKKSRLIPNFVNIQKFRRYHTNNVVHKMRVVVISRLDYSKDPITVIRAFKLVTMAIPEARLQIVGDGPLHDRVEALIRELNMERSIVLVGRQLNVRKFLWSNDIFIATKAGYLALIEAWAAGLAVIAPRIGILKEIVVDNENGLLVDYHNEKQLSAAIINLIKDPDLRKRLVSKGMDAVQKHDISEVAPEIAKIYINLKHYFS